MRKGFKATKRVFVSWNNKKVISCKIYNVNLFLRKLQSKAQFVGGGINNLVLTLYLLTETLSRIRSLILLEVFYKPYLLKWAMQLSI